MTLSVIIVNFNVRQFLENALTSLVRAMEGIEGEIFVVDNASDDGSTEMVKNKFPGVHLISNEVNRGFARANNQALQLATGEYLLLINPDTVVQEDTLRVMLGFFERNPDAGLAGCTILNPDGSLQLSCRRSYPTPWVAFTKITGLSTLFPKSPVFGKYNLTYRDPDGTYPVDAISGSFMMMTRQAYSRVGGLDEVFFMYGEDLDWCYRVREAGYRVYYVHETQIVHYKGESTRRSNIDEVRVFYGAMELFVQKHFQGSPVLVLVLRLGIALRAAAAWGVRTLQPVGLALIDILFVVAALILGEYLYFGRLFRFPSYAYPVAWTVPALLVAAVGSIAGIYSAHRFSIVRSAVTVFVSFVIVAATVFFAKDFAFSRAVLLIAGLITFVMVPGWRSAALLIGRQRWLQPQRRSLFGSRTVIVGTGSAGQEVLRRLRARVAGGYDVVGLIDTTNARVGEKISGVEVVGTVENIGKVIEERRITDVILSTDELPYTTILSMIARSSKRRVNFRMVPTSLEAIIGKTRIDYLDPLPLVEIEYNLHRPSHRISKRIFDVVLSLLLLCTLYPVVRLASAARLVRRDSRLPAALAHLPRVLKGELSLVGRPLPDTSLSGSDGSRAMPLEEGPSLGRYGLTGLVQVTPLDSLPPEDIERYELYYAKNQSLLLDIEILSKAALKVVRR